MIPAPVYQLLEPVRCRSMPKRNAANHSSASQVQHGGTEQYSDWYRRRRFAILNVLFAALSLTIMALALLAVSWRIWSVRALVWCDLHSVAYCRCRQSAQPAGRVVLVRQHLSYSIRGLASHDIAKRAELMLCTSCLCYMLAFRLHREHCMNSIHYQNESLLMCLQRVATFRSPRRFKLCACHCVILIIQIGALARQIRPVLASDLPVLPSAGSPLGESPLLCRVFPGTTNPDVTTVDADVTTRWDAVNAVFWLAPNVVLLFDRCAWYSDFTDTAGFIRWCAFICSPVRTRSQGKIKRGLLASSPNIMCFMPRNLYTPFGLCACA